MLPLPAGREKTASEWQKKRKRPGPGGAYADKPNETLVLSIGDCDDALEGCALYGSSAWLATRFAYKDDEIRSLVMELGYIPVVPSKSNRRNPQDYDKQLYRQRKSG